MEAGGMRGVHMDVPGEIGRLRANHAPATHPAFFNLGDDMSEASEITAELDSLIQRAQKHERPEMLLRQMAEWVIDALNECGPKAHDHLKRLTTCCLECERNRR
jgi:hypothetical protein